MFAVEALKSVILTLCCVDRRLSVDQVVLLSRLEEEYQVLFYYIFKVIFITVKFPRYS